MAERKSSAREALVPLLGIVAVIAIAFVAFSEDCGGSSSPAPVEVEPVEAVEEEAFEEAEGYHLAFAEDFNPALASRDDLGISVVIAVDCSGSMSEAPLSGGQEKYKQAAAALLSVCDVLDRLLAEEGQALRLRVGLIGFDERLREIMPLTDMTAASLRKLRELASRPSTFEPGGKTALGRAIERGVELLAQSGTLMRSLIVISDGLTTAGVEPEEVLDAVYADRNSASTRDWPVRTNATFVSVIGFDIQGEQFASLALRGARVSAASNREELSRVIERLLRADITKLEAPDEGGK
jgi:hypothetical protein